MVEKNKKTGYFISLFLLQLFERFSFFGFFYILIFFCINNLNLTESEAAVFAGSFTALCYILSSFGGVIADRFLGVRRALLTGGTSLLIGYLLLASGDTFSSITIYIGLAMIIAGACLFVPMTLNSVSRVYADEPEKLDAIYAYFNMANNFGALAGALLIPYLSSADSYGLENRHYGIALSVCAIGVFAALINVLLNRKLFFSIATPIGKQALGFKKLVGLFIGLIVFISVISVLLFYSWMINFILAIAVVVIVSYFI